MTRILVADDHPIMRSAVEGILREAGYDVVAAVSTGAAALEAITESTPDILVLDVQMPDRTGLDVLRIVRGRGDQRPIVLLTAELDDRQLVEAIELKVSGILFKEGAEDLLLRCIEEVRSGGRWIDKGLLQRALDVSMNSPASAGGAARSLSAREKAIVGLVARGLRNREVASELGLTEGTVKVYLYRIYEKVGVTNRTELAVFAREHSLG